MPHFLLKQSLKTKEKEEKQKRANMIHKSETTFWQISSHDLPADGVTANTIKDKMMPQAAILSEQVFLRAGTFLNSKTEYANVLQRNINTFA